VVLAKVCAPGGGDVEGFGGSGAVPEGEDVDVGEGVDPVGRGHLDGVEHLHPLLPVGQRPLSLLVLGLLPPPRGEPHRFTLHNLQIRLKPCAQVSIVHTSDVGDGIVFGFLEGEVLEDEAVLGVCWEDFGFFVGRGRVWRGQSRK